MHVVWSYFVQGDGLFPAKYKLKDLNPGSTPLDPFHTHFILVDNGTVHKPGVEIKLRVNLEAEIAKQCRLCIMDVHFHVHVYVIDIYKMKHGEVAHNYMIIIEKCRLFGVTR